MELSATGATLMREFPSSPDWNTRAAVYAAWLYEGAEVTLLGSVGRAISTFAGAIAAFVVGWFLWKAALYSHIVPMPKALSPSALSLLIPLLFSVTFIAWSVARAVTPQRDRALRVRRIGEFAIVAMAAAAVEAAHVLRVELFLDAAARNKPVGATVSFLLLGSVVVVSLVKDRDADTALLLLMCTLSAIVPLVVVGRIAGQMLVAMLLSVGF